MENDSYVELEQVEQPAVESSAVPVKFSCNRCEKSFDSKKEFVGHTSRSHKRGKNIMQSGDFACTECPKKFKVLRALQGHQRIHENQNVQEISNVNDFIVLEVHQPTPASVEKINDTTMNEVQQSVNALVETENENDTILEQVQQLLTESSKESVNFPCDKCEKSFKSNQQLVGHVSRSHKYGKNVSHPDGEYSCNICLRDFSYFRAFQAHQRMHPRLISSNNLERTYE